MEKWHFKRIITGENKDIPKTKPLQLGKFLDFCVLNDNDENITEEVHANFRHPYVVKVTYDPPLNEDDEPIFLPYYEDGFLATSQMGDVALISRFSKAINRLWTCNYYSPNLAMWLFDITKARLPQNTDTDIVVDRWLNTDIGNNENQKEAIHKMLAAPDVCLIQGPPGTGKTTVIAEAIYQFVKKGNKVLITSQSNDAVDNALEKLSSTPEIRAIRLGKKGKIKRRHSNSTGVGEQNGLSEISSLEGYYNVLSECLSKNWLDKWDKLDSSIQTYRKDLQDARLCEQDIALLNEQKGQKNKQLEEISLSYNEIKKSYEEAKELNEQLEAGKRQLQFLENLVNNLEETTFFLSKDVLQPFVLAIKSLFAIEDLKEVQLLPRDTNLDLLDSESLCSFITLLVKNLATLRQLVKKIDNFKVDNNKDNCEAHIIQAQIDDVKDKLMACFDADDDEGIKIYKEKRRELKQKLEKLGKASKLEFSNVEKGILSPTLQEQINSGNNDCVTLILQKAFDAYTDNLKDALAKTKVKINNSARVDIQEIKQRLAVENSNAILVRDEIKEIDKQINAKDNTLNVLAQKYIDTTQSYNLITLIEQRLQNAMTNLESSKSFRAVWETTIRGFKEKLDKTNSSDTANTRIMLTYIKSCNVVGISCTDNMYNLDSNGFNNFDVVIIDEVSKATPPELLIPMLRAKKVILVGDHRQLPPMFNEQEKSYIELRNEITTSDEETDDIQNLQDVAEETSEIEQNRRLANVLTLDNFKKFEKMVTASLFKEYFETADLRIKHSLLTQFRMHSDIMNIINRFYGHKLTSGLSQDEEKRKKCHGLNLIGVDGSPFVTTTHHAYWVDSSCLPHGSPVYETFKLGSTSACNILEKYIIIELLKKIADAYKNLGYTKRNPKSVGVISFYQMQVNEIRHKYREVAKTYDFSSIDVDINTVDRFQGKEKNIIITSLVRNNRNAQVSRHVVTFERINVAFSRAQELLFIVGAKHMYSQLEIKLPNMDTPGFKTVPVYRNIMDDLQQKGCLFSSNKLIDDDTERRIMLDIQSNKGDRNANR